MTIPMFQSCRAVISICRRRSGLASRASDSTSSSTLAGGVGPDISQTLVLEDAFQPLQTTAPNKSDRSTSQAEPLRHLVVRLRGMLEEQKRDHLAAAGGQHFNRVADELFALEIGHHIAGHR